MKSLAVEFVRPDGQLLRVIDAGFDFIDSTGIPLKDVERPLRIETDGTLQLAAILLPDGNRTAMQLTGKNVPMSGRPISLTGRVVIDGTQYELTVCISSELKALTEAPTPNPEPALRPLPRHLKCPRPGCQGYFTRRRKIRVGSGIVEFLGCSEWPECTRTRDFNSR